jgi:hypothetical protein
MPRSCPNSSGRVGRNIADLGRLAAIAARTHPAWAHCASTSSRKAIVHIEICVGSFGPLGQPIDSILSSTVPRPVGESEVQST